MSKSNIRLIVTIIIGIAMFGIFKSLFSSGNTEGVKEAVAQGALLVDVRSPGEFASGSVKGAVNVPVGEIASKISKFQGKPGVVVFCRSGARSAQAKQILEQNGIENVINGGTWKDVEMALIP